jgi:hypothetical protein
VQFAGLAAEMIQIGVAGKLGHDASPHRAWTRVPARPKTVLPSSFTQLSRAEADSVLPAGPVAPSRADIQPTAPTGSSLASAGPTTGCRQDRADRTVNEAAGYTACNLHVACGLTNLRPRKARQYRRRRVPLRRPERRRLEDVPGGVRPCPRTTGNGCRPADASRHQAYALPLTLKQRGVRSAR